MDEPLYRSRPGGFEIQPASMPEARRVAPGIYLSEGLSNSFLVVTAEGRVVVNTGMGFEAPVHRRNFDAIDTSPVRYVLLTQGHVDHVGGVDLFLEEGCEVVTQAGNAAHQADDGRIARFRAKRSAFAFGPAIAKSQRYIRESTGGAVSGQSVPKPTITFEDHFAFELGGERFELLAASGGETTDSMLVWLPDRKICFAGNLFSALFGHFPNLVTIRGDRYRDPLRFVDSLDRVLGLEPELLLVGHHDPIEGAELIRRELLRLRSAVLYVHDEVVRGMNEGSDVFSLMREIEVPPEFEVGQGYGKVAWSVRAIWENYAGWFHHRSSCELYPLSPQALHPDLVELAGGPDPVCERARKRHEGGEPVLAIQLAEAALAADPSHRASQEVSLAAHRSLLAASENFWESAWLKRQVGQLEAAISLD